MKNRQRQQSLHTLATLLLTTLPSPSIAQAVTNGSKRGIAYLGTSHPSDYNIFLSGASPLTWYYNWSPYPVYQPSGFSNLEFVPLIHNLGTLNSDIQQVKSLNSKHTHLLTFNEPDASTEGGGSDISPPDAAQAYHDSINPLSVANGGDFYISWPSTTGTLSGLNWLKEFNVSCYSIDPTHGCHMDFIATHFYGDFPALASWLGILNEYFNTNTSSNFGMWITEVALPQQDAQVTDRMMNETLPYLDGLEYVDRYAWFGMNRIDNANGWTGSGVCLLDDQGDLTELGARYLNGDGSGNDTFKVGMSAADGVNGVGGREGMLRGGLVVIVWAVVVCLGMQWII